MAVLKKTERGRRIIMVQEDRFRMVDDIGRGYLFTLSHKARTNAKDLKRWHDSGVKVLVRYYGEPNLASGVAREVEPEKKQ